MNGVIGNRQVIIKFMVIVLGLINAFENIVYNHYTGHSGNNRFREHASEDYAHKPAENVPVF